MWDTAQDNILIFQIIFLPYSSPWTGDSSAHHEGRRQTSWSRTTVRLAWQGAGSNILITIDILLDHVEYFLFSEQPHIMVWYGHCLESHFFGIFEVRIRSPYLV